MTWDFSTEPEFEDQPPARTQTVPAGVQDPTDPSQAVVAAKQSHVRFVADHLT